MGLNNFQSHCFSSLVIIFLILSKHLVLGYYARRSASKASYERSKLNQVTITPGSAIVCAGVCHITKGCNSYKLEDQNCLLLNGSQLISPTENEDKIQLNVDISFLPIHGSWSQWRSSDLSSRLQIRTCDNPKPQFLGADCIGPNNRTANYSIENRPFKVLHFHGNKSTTGDWETEQFCHQDFVTSFGTKSSEENSFSKAVLTDFVMLCNDGTSLGNGKQIKSANLSPKDHCMRGYNAARINVLVLDEASGSQKQSFVRSLQLKCSSSEWNPKTPDLNAVEFESKYCENNALICGLHIRECEDVNDFSFFCFNGIKILCCSDVHV